MKNNLRYIIREQLEKIIESQENSLAGDAINDIQNQVADTQEYLDNLEKETQSSIKTDEKLLNVDRQRRSNSPTTIKIDGESVANPTRKGLDQELPAKQKVIDARKKALKNIEKAQKNYQKMSDDLKKKELDLKKSEKEGGSSNTILPSLNSPI